MWPSDISAGDFAETLPGAVLVVEPDARVVAANGRGKKLFGLSKDEPRLTAYMIGEPDAFVGYLRQCAACRSPLPGGILLDDDGDVRRIAVTGMRLPGKAARIVLQCDDLAASTAHKRFGALNDKIRELSQEVGARRRAEALLEAQKQVLANVVSGVDLEKALDGFLQSIEQLSSGMLISVLLLDDKQCLRHTAAPSLPERYCRAIDGLAIGPNVGSCGTAAFTGKLTIASDITTDVRWADYREVALRENLRACWSAPIFGSSKEVLGTLALYYRAVREPTRMELRTIRNCAHIASLAIERYRSQKALEALLATEQQLRCEAERQSTAKDHFLAVLSHELRNPLAAAANAAMALDAMGQADEKQASLLGVIQSEVDILRRILDDLLDVSRLSVGKIQLRLEAVDTGSLLRSVGKAFRLTTPDREVVVALPEALPLIEADRARLEQIVNNLLENARKYSDAGNRIELRAEHVDSNLLIHVQDNGIGIEPELLQGLFEPFAQLDESLDRSGSGLGLGLSLVQQFTDLHGGSVSAVSEGPGKGSKFTLSFPVKPLSRPVEQPPSEPAPTPVKRRVLVVEDNEAAREGLCHLLSFWGHEVTGAGDGEEALECVRSHPPDLALVDIGLPRMDGYQLARAIREQERNGDIQLVALTGYGQESDRKRSKEAGFDAHIVKPVKRDELEALLAEQR